MIQFNTTKEHFNEARRLYERGEKPPLHLKNAYAAIKRNEGLKKQKEAKKKRLLEHYRESLTAGELSRITGISRSSISVYLKELKEEGKIKG